MDFRALLRNRLDQNGWEVATIDDDTDWWVDQHWEVRSTRQANGLTLFLNLLVDPQHEGTQQEQCCLVNNCINTSASRANGHHRPSCRNGDAEGAACPKSQHVYR